MDVRWVLLPWIQIVVEKCVIYDALRYKLNSTSNTIELSWCCTKAKCEARMRTDNTCTTVISYTQQSNDGLAAQDKTSAKVIKSRYFYISLKCPLFFRSNVHLVWLKCPVNMLKCPAPGSLAILYCLKQTDQIVKTCWLIIDFLYILNVVN